MHIVDRRLNPSGKNLANRQRFMRRAKSLIRKAVHESSASRSIKDADQAGEVALRLLLLPRQPGKLFGMNAADELRPDRT